MNTTIVWFRQDLRLSDNPAVQAALRNSKKIIFLYCHTDTESGEWSLGQASRWWLHKSLAALDDALKQRGNRLITRHGDSLKTLQQLISQTGASQVYCNTLYEPAHISRDTVVSAWMENNGIDFHLYHGNLLADPSTVWNKQGQPYKVFTPFYRYHITHGLNTKLISTPRSLPPTPASIKSTTINSLKLLSKNPWHVKFEKYWRPGERGAQKKLTDFCKTSLSGYPELRDIPSASGTSSLSPHLHFGEISPRQIINAILKSSNSITDNVKLNAQDAVIRQLIWRDFASYILVHFPHTSSEPFNEKFKKFPWKKNDRKFLRAWETGTTGIPIIDAGMRELWETGTMHNRVRMLVASLLTKNASLHWHHGAHWFWDTLLDADLANNSMNWQWVAGCGVDAAPYFRIFNPVTQGGKFDPAGEYVKTWIPELKSMPAKYIHDPWNASTIDQQQANCIIGKDYPKPVLNISETRQRALHNYRKLRDA